MEGDTSCGLQANCTSPPNAAVDHPQHWENYAQNQNPQQATQPPPPSLSQIQPPVAPQSQKGYLSSQAGVQVDIAPVNNWSSAAQRRGPPWCLLVWLVGWCGVVLLALLVFDVRLGFGWGAAEFLSVNTRRLRLSVRVLWLVKRASGRARTGAGLASASLCPCSITGSLRAVDERSLFLVGGPG